MQNLIGIENEALKVQIVPGYGGKVRSIVDKADGYELLFDYHNTRPQAPVYDIPYGEGWYAGWDECFPGIGRGSYPQAPYTGTIVPDHGELWGIPTISTVARNSITTQWHGIRFGYSLTRQLSLSGATLTADYTLENLAPAEFRFVWALHSLMGLTLPTHFDFAGDKAWRLSHDAKGDEPHERFNWPITQHGDDVSNLGTLPPGRGWKVFSQQPIDRPFKIAYPTRKRVLSIGYSSQDVAAYWGVWINTGGWAGHKHFAVEPTTGRYDALEGSVQDGSAARLAPLATARWHVTWTVA